MRSSSYVDNGTQTIIEGLAKHPVAVPPELQPSTPPPDEMPVKNDANPPPAQDKPARDSTQSEEQLPSTMDLPSIGLPDRIDTSVSEARPIKKRPPFRARISLPGLTLDAEGPNSPPPTEAPLSPLPAANKLHAGHTPIVPRSLSPLRDQKLDDDVHPEPEPDPEHQPEPDLDLALQGPLTLPPKPGDGADDRIELKALDAELERIAREQQAFVEQHNEEIPSTSETQIQEPAEQGSRVESAGASRRSSAEDDVEIIDGIRLKKPRMNMGAPLGQA